MSKVYLAGPITNCSYEDCADWREYAIKALKMRGIQGISPMRAKEYLAGEARIKASYPGRVLSCDRGITTRDRNDVMTCDLVLANFLGSQSVSVGTMIELGWADAWRKPVIVVIQERNIHDHPMVREIAGFRVDALDEAIAVASIVLAAE